MITAVLMMGVVAGSKNAAKVANGSVFGMIGGVFCVATVWFVLTVTGNWLLSIGLGLVLWLVSSIAVSVLRDRIENIGIHPIKNRWGLFHEPHVKNDK